ncbi:hypothetical protein SB719_22950, partial [Pantoea sp. SIMBA_079]|uniref:hypothetical protein n=1 Tax=Pantoea sp. SIMBA_079 TaxID=3085817 RepID=UPI00399247C3
CASENGLVAMGQTESGAGSKLRKYRRVGGIIMASLKLVLFRVPDPAAASFFPPRTTAFIGPLVFVPPFAR